MKDFSCFLSYKVLLNKIELLLSITKVISNFVSHSKCDGFARFRVGHCEQNCEALTLFPMGK